MNTPSILRRVSLKPYNTFGIDVEAEFFAHVKSLEDIKTLLSEDQLQGLPLLILGGGSNILFTENVKGLVLLNEISGIEIISEDDHQVVVKAGAGVNWHELVSYTVQKGWGGLENLSLIPGTVGAAPIQNIGAYGAELKDSFVELEALQLDDKSIVRFTREDCHFGYRDSIFKREGKGKFMILAVTFKLSKQPVLNTRYGAIEQQLSSVGITSPTVHDVSQAVIAIRSSKLPDPKKIGNAGSFFKNPEIPLQQFEALRSLHPDMVSYPVGQHHVKVAAGWLIEKAGWKGKAIGHVSMHSQQALVLVNLGGATGKELLAHAKSVQHDVEQKFGIVLEMEVNIR